MAISKNKKVLVGGCFDLIHAGHIHLLKHAKKVADTLIVAVLSDKYIRSYKGKQRPVFDEKHRLLIIKSMRYVDEAFICNEDPYGLNILRKIDPDAIILRAEGFETKKRIIKKEFTKLKIIKLKRYKSDFVSTTHIINKIKSS
ncbi:MAG: glycerol-3-phosphate cytidylyltransferase [Candidatus Yanofskybacteria bacterium GW2011_GWA1_39_13]|uniref:Glycerol-3-phosphate cytidylyltransferase n=1 Tax=Yanofskybacteria sp. (strain GW2011_GWA1_39_13) TaxID=1619019 RepID=A0A0G0MQ08_YANXG|nr:MAG: glycerol-3-phosphate cytidylyltransferase [Candidatus Yanofskybacteria bacterium GW2011_GWA1_39_13]